MIGHRLQLCGTCWCRALCLEFDTGKSYHDSKVSWACRSLQRCNSRAEVVVPHSVKARFHWGVRGLTRRRGRGRANFQPVSGLKFEGCWQVLNRRSWGCRNPLWPSWSCSTGSSFDCFYCSKSELLLTPDFDFYNFDSFLSLWCVYATLWFSSITIVWGPGCRPTARVELSKECCFWNLGLKDDNSSWRNPKLSIPIF